MVNKTKEDIRCKHCGDLPFVSQLGKSDIIIMCCQIFIKESSPNRAITEWQDKNSG